MRQKEQEHVIDRSPGVNETADELMQTITEQ